MTQVAILLVHGFSGSDRDLFPLAERLRDVWGRESVHLPLLPGHHPGESVDGFDLERLLTPISLLLEKLRRSADTLIVLGHSTGGNLILAALEQAGVIPDLLVLAATPFRIDLDYLERWQNHQQKREALSLTTLSGLIKMINKGADNLLVPPCPSLLLYGGADGLIPSREAQLWQQNLAGEAQLIELPESGHQLFCDPGWGSVAEILIEKFTKRLTGDKWELDQFSQRLIAVEPEAAQYVAARREQLRHLMRSPSGARLQEEKVDLPEIVPWAPVFANIEITTFCNFGCRHCARTVLCSTEKMMSKELFEQLLDRLPSAYRVTLVGLGEPLMHPQLNELITLAKNRGHRVGMVTNAQFLNSQYSAEILDAGLDSIVFSLDTVDPELLSQLRAGSDLSVIEENIRDFCVQAEGQSRPVSKAVFSAVSAASFAGLEKLINQVSSFGVHVLMLSDLNFIYNQEESLSSYIDGGQEKQLRRVISQGFSQGLPVLGVRALEDFGLAKNYQDALLLPVQQLYQRSERHRYCFSPWQTLSLNVDGEVCLCDCQSEQKLGNLQMQSLASLWNCSKMRKHRRQMLSMQPPPECLICPRF